MKTLLQPLLMAALAASAASAQPLPKPSEPAGNPPFSLTVTLRPRRIAKVGDPVNLDILLTNTSGRDLEIRGRKGGQGWAEGDQIDVRDAQGTEIPRKESAPQPQQPVRFYDQFMEPGKFGLDYIRLDTHYDISKPGQYTISVERPDAASKVVVKSNTVTLTISEDPPPPHSPSGLARARTLRRLAIRSSSTSTSPTRQAKSGDS